MKNLPQRAQRTLRRCSGQAQREKAKISFLIVVLAGFLSFSFAADNIAVIIKMKGAVQLQTPGKNDWQAAKKGQMVASGSKIKTGDNGLVMVKFLDDKSMVRMKPKSILTVVGQKEQRVVNKEVNITLGSVLFNVDKKHKKGEFHVKTPTSVATVKGTKFWVVVDKNGVTSVVTLEDIVALLNLGSGVSKDVGPGQTGVSDDKGVTVRETKPDDLSEGKETRKMEIKFKDKDGNTKDLIIEFDKTE